MNPMLHSPRSMVEVPYGFHFVAARRHVSTLGSMDYPAEPTSVEETANAGPWVAPDSVLVGAHTEYPVTCTSFPPGMKKLK